MSDLMMMMTMMTRACVCSDNSGKVFPAYIGNNFSIELSLYRYIQTAESSPAGSGTKLKLTQRQVGQRHLA